ncbi:glycoside hydrolase family 3 N-terminal domain-containing protein [Roseofilum casamattae]|uniref:beta-N-acetylhexosaminidase n=1 Tax=Roseofilum casamattae BLCC-M143 TaxID=3022442 RepID=A0ABT7BUJ1_9CYAN|nr:glycoside hydrolase family 3 N-terminal domain-containing protein [Roseofilum casamattae]MDJ1182864.1 glycoside hydrolase family 3 N-terminal domain-containing protein [Roseofilum casamattae BLCC-M143]
MGNPQFHRPDLALLSLEQQVAQMVVVRAAGYRFDHQIRYPNWEPPNKTLHEWIAHLGVGGIILVGGSAAELRDRISSLQALAEIPLLVGADVEEGVGQRFSAATHFPPPMALGAIAKQSPETAIEYARKMGEMTAREALALGINWLYAPVSDVNNNPNNPVINVRAFAETVETTSTLISAYIQGARVHPILTTAKHFPGHGDTAVDSHLQLPVLPHSPERLAEVELVPFQHAIAAGVDAVMTAHLSIPAWDTEEPATLSAKILTEKLRQELGFSGLIVTDALVMGAIANHYGTNEAAVLAVQAGADILLMPGDPPGAIAAVCDAVREGKITPERIQASVERIWQAKEKIAAPDIPQFPQAIGNIDTRETARAITRDAQTVGGKLHLVPKPGYNLIAVDDALDCAVLAKPAPAIILPEEEGYKLQLVDSHTPYPLPTWEEPTLLQLFVRGHPFRGSSQLNDRAIALFQELVKTGHLQALVLYGSPYILDLLQPQLPADIPYVFSYGQMPDAQAIALQTLGFKST